MDINTKKLKKNAFRITKERGITASRVRVPGGHLDAELLGKIQEISEKYGNGKVVFVDILNRTYKVDIDNDIKTVDLGNLKDE